MDWVDPEDAAPPDGLRPAVQWCREIFLSGRELRVVRCPYATQPQVWTAGRIAAATTIGASTRQAHHREREVCFAIKSRSQGDRPVPRELRSAGLQLDRADIAAAFECGRKLGTHNKLWLEI